MTKDIREQISREMKVFGEIRNILLSEMKKKMTVIYHDGYDPRSRGLALVLPKP